MPVGWEDLRPILPALILMAGAMMIVALDLLRKRGLPPWFLLLAGYVSVGGALVWLWYITASVQSFNEPGFGGAVVFDGFSHFLTITILFGTALSLFLSNNLALRFKVQIAEVLALILIAAAGMILLVMARELITLFLSLELMSISVYILAGVTRDRPESNEASLKYFVIGSFASAILLYGFVLLYGATGRIELAEISAALSGPEPPSALLITGLALSLVGFGFKVGAVPFHVWVPDAYQGAPTSITAFMSVTVKAAGFGVLLRFLIEGLGPESLRIYWHEAIIVMALASIVIGNLVALAQKSVKRMLAYSSIAHTGYLLIGVAAAAEPGAIHPIAATGFYLFAYTFMTFGAFAILIYVGREGNDADTFDDFEGLAKRRPMAALAMAIFMISLAGLPPTAGFFAKFYIFKAAIEIAGSGSGALVWAVIVAIVMSVVSLYYYLRVVVAMYLKPGAEGGAPEKVDYDTGFAVSIAALVTVLLGLVPGVYLHMAYVLASQWVD
jgi:NADH-quinone oxidoreductase subunit N